MKKIQVLLFSFVLSFFLIGCGDGNSSENKPNGDTTTSQGSGSEDSGNNGSANIAISTWDGHSLRAESTTKGKWLASVSFGEEMTLLGESAKDGKRDYEKVRLLDGKTGWVRADLISKSAKMAAVKSDAQIYKRPSISNITDDMLGSGELIVITQKKEEFSEFVSRNGANNKRKKGWVLGSAAITTDEINIAVAVMLGKAKEEKNPIKRKQKLEQIINNSSFSGSDFIADVQAQIAETEAAATLGEDELMITAENVNIRSEPDVEGDNKLFIAHSGDLCNILQRGEMAEISDNLDYWYQISLNGQTGWVFGSLTSKAL